MKDQRVCGRMAKVVKIQGRKLKTGVDSGAHAARQRRMRSGAAGTRVWPVSTRSGEQPLWGAVGSPWPWHLPKTSDDLGLHKTYR